MEFNLRLCGEAGQGLQSVGKILLSALGRRGWHVYAHQDYESRIRGGCNFFQIRLAERRLTAFAPRIDLLVAMTPESYQAFSSDLRPGGIAVHPGPGSDQGRGIVVDFAKTAQEQAGNAKTASAVVAGLTWALLDHDLVPLEDEVAAFFAPLGDKLVAANRLAVRAGFDLARARGLEPRVTPPGSAPPRLLIRGNDAVALGAMAAGLKFISSYPMTPSTSIVEYIASHGQEAGIWVEQAEDEIAAINMAIGASYAGARAMTTTSGGGFCLMTEAIGLAASAEIPVVVVNGQRPGPSTGLPTRTEQGDLLFAINAGHGDFPLAVLAPGSISECFSIMGHAFNIADEYQLPVVVLTDQYIADSFQTVPPFDVDAIPIERGVMGKATGDYKRYALTESGISPRLYPGTEPAVVVCAGDEHDQQGHLIEDAATRVLMMEKRMRKLELLRQRALSPVTAGASAPRLVLVTWGSTWGIVQQALEELDGVRAIHLPQLWPLPQDQLGKLLPPDVPVYTAESNYSGQLAGLLAMHGINTAGSIRRYDGRPLSSEEIVKQVREVL